MVYPWCDYSWNRSIHQYRLPNQTMNWNHGSKEMTLEICNNQDTIWYSAHDRSIRIPIFWQAIGFCMRKSCKTSSRKTWQLPWGVQVIYSTKDMPSRTRKAIQWMGCMAQRITSTLRILWTFVIDRREVTVWEICLYYFHRVWEKKCHGMMILSEVINSWKTLLGIYFLA